MVADGISDLLTRVRNSQKRGMKSVKILKSVMGRRVLDILKDEGFIESYEEKVPTGETFPVYVVWLKYYEGGRRPLVQVAQRVSKPGRRVYKRANELPKIQGGLGINIISTSQGVMSDREARRRNIGGEVLARIA